MISPRWIICKACGQGYIGTRTSKCTKCGHYPGEAT